LVYIQPFLRNSLLKCVSQPKIAKNSLKPPILGVQGHLRSSMFTFLRSSSPGLAIISIMFVPICNHFHVRRANNGRITLFKGEGAPLYPFRSWGPPSPSGIKFCHKIPKTLRFLSYGENQKSRSHLGSDGYRVVTDATRHQDRITIANTLALERRKQEI